MFEFFIIVFPGIASIASFTLATVNPIAIGESGTPGIGVPVFGSLFQIGFAFAFGIAFAIITCAPVSGGHFNPAITICFALYQGFPWRKVPHYIFSQIFGAFIAGLLLMGCYWPEIQAAKAVQLAEHGTVHYNGGVASILCSYPNANQTNQGFLFLQEWFVDSFIGIVIWSCLDPGNPFMTAASAPWSIGLAYAVMVWGFAGNTISTNLARDLGTRIVAAIFFGGEAFSVDNGYSWISILVNVPATVFAAGYYELLIRDSLVAVGQGHKQFEGGQDGVRELVRTLTRDEEVAGAMAAVGDDRKSWGMMDSSDGSDGVGADGGGKEGRRSGGLVDGHVENGAVGEDVVRGRDWA